MDSATLYDDDILTWSEQQAAALRSLAARPDLSNAVDWGNVIEEIECLGRSEWKAVESQIRNALTHIIKAYCDPDSLSRQAWSAETSAFLDEARTEFRPSMRQQLDMERAWLRAFKRAVEDLRPYGVRIPPGIPPRSPFSLDEILSEAFSYETALKALYDRQREISPNSEDRTP
jgi:hypothetical protein